ncbi:MAG TPA: hypothetical protein VME47_08450 [Acetobacteraceae bacterium]|nr:hypothetical protein [Acetobacteraceae bacterium]
MLDFPQVSEVCAEVARAMFPGQQIESISVEPRIGAFGDDLLWITAVIQGDGPGWPDGEAIGAYALAVSDELEKQGDERLAIVELLTPEEAAEVVESES